MSSSALETLNRVWNFLKPAPTNWEFATSDGTEASVGRFGSPIGVGVAKGHFYVRQRGGAAIYRLGFSAVSISGTAGLPLPLGVAHSEYQWPAQGLGRIWKTSMTRTHNPPATFAGPCLMYGLGASLGPFTSRHLGAYGATLVFLGGNGAAKYLPNIPAFFKYVGVLYGFSAAMPGVGVTGYFGHVTTQEEGEDRNNQWVPTRTRPTIRQG